MPAFIVSLNLKIMIQLSPQGFTATSTSIFVLAPHDFRAIFPTTPSLRTNFSYIAAISPRAYHQRESQIAEYSISLRGHARYCYETR